MTWKHQSLAANVAPRAMSRVASAGFGPRRTGSGSQRMFSPSHRACLGSQRPCHLYCASQQVTSAVLPLPTTLKQSGINAYNGRSHASHASARETGKHRVSVAAVSTPCVCCIGHVCTRRIEHTVAHHDGYRFQQRRTAGPGTANGGIWRPDAISSARANKTLECSPETLCPTRDTK